MAACYPPWQTESLYPYPDSITADSCTWMHATYTEYLYRCANELYITLLSLFPIPYPDHRRENSGRHFITVAVGQEAVAELVQELNQRRNQQCLASGQSTASAPGFGSAI